METVGSLSGEKTVSLLWNKGIAAMCDRRIPDEFPEGVYVSQPTLAGMLSSPKLPDHMIANPALYFDIQEGELVWVRLSWLKSFVRQVLPEIRSKFVLVTGDSDSCVPSELQTDANVILENSYVLHWYTQNYDGSPCHGKISPIPIGIDFHMLSERSAWGESQCSPVEQETLLNALRDELPPLNKRIPKAYVDFAWQQGLGLRHYRRFHPLHGATLRELRRKVARKLRTKDCVFCQPSFLSRTEMWRQRGKYAFVVSPHGVGLDCHRTWEALALGHIVLVPSSSLNSLYDGLPVVTIRSWDDINEANLERWMGIYSACAAPYEKLTSHYWVEQMELHFRRRL